MTRTRKRFREGQRIRLARTDIFEGLPEGATGTTALIAGFRGKSVYCDPARLLVFVKWDEHGERSTWANLLEHIKEEEKPCS